jgi:hypothetical protein
VAWVLLVLYELARAGKTTIFIIKVIQCQNMYHKIIKVDAEQAITVSQLFIYMYVCMVILYILYIIL